MKDTESAVWDPEKAYRQVRGSNRRLLAFIVMVILLGAAWIGINLENMQEYGDAGLKDVKSFAEADRKLQEEGFEPFTEATQYSDKWERLYREREILGHTTAYCELEGADGKNGWLRLHYLFEEDGGTDSRKPGEVFQDSLKKMKRKYGEPEEYSGMFTTYYIWYPDKHTSVIAGYLTTGCPMLCYEYELEEKGEI